MVPTPSLPMEISLRFGRSAESTSGSILPVVTPRGGNYQSSARSPTLPLFSSRQLRRQSWFPPVESPKCGDWMVPQLLPAPNSRTPLVVLSHCGTYIATWYQAGSTITITGPHSQTTPHFIDTGMEIFVLGFTGNILLVLEKTRIPMGLANLVAWRLTERGVVDGILQTEGQVAVTAFGP